MYINKSDFLFANMIILSKSLVLWQFSQGPARQDLDVEKILLAGLSDVAEPGKVVGPRCMPQIERQTPWCCVEIFQIVLRTPKQLICG